MAHYLLAASSIPGHVTPLITIGEDLVRRGHDVTFLADAEYRERVGRKGMRHHPLPVAAAPRPFKHLGLPSGLLQRYVAGRQDMSAVFIAPLAGQWGAVDRLLERRRVDAVLCDVAFTGVLPLLLSGRYRPPVIVCGVGPLMLSSSDAPPFGMSWHPQPLTDYRRMNQFVGEVLFRDIRSHLDQTLRSVGAPALPVFLPDWPLLADRVLQLSIPELEYPRRDLPETVTFAGPVLPYELPSKPFRRRRRCAKTVVHVTQGTWDNRDLTELIVPTVRALGSRDDTTVVATTGWPGLTSLPVTLPDNVVVTDYASYERLLPKVDVMVTNGGFGGVHQALAYGIPLVIAGATSDKPEVAARVAYTGAGINLHTARPKPRHVADAVERVLTQPGYRRAAQRLGRELLRYNAFDHIAATLAEFTDVSNEHVG